MVIAVASHARACVCVCVCPCAGVNIKIISLQVIYGGKTIDIFDKRVLETYLTEYLGGFLFDKFQPFTFSFGDDDADRIRYRIPLANQSGNPNIGIDLAL